MQEPISFASSHPIARSTSTEGAWEALLRGNIHYDSLSLAGRELRVHAPICEESQHGKTHNREEK